MTVAVKDAFEALIAHMQMYEKCSKKASAEWDQFLILNFLISELEDVQATSNDYKKEDDVTANFLSWLAENGLREGVIEIKEFGVMGKGLVAKKDLEESDLMVQVPDKLFMSTETAMSSAHAAIFVKYPLFSAQPNVLLAAHLLAEARNPNSFWKPYIDSLPQDFSTPLWWNICELQLLDGTSVQSEVMTYIRHVVKLYIMFSMVNDREDCFLGNNLPYKDFKWAISVVMTRQNQVPINGKPCMALIPLWDLSNHSNGRITSFYNEETKCIECTAMKSFAAGEQVTMFYGPRTSAEFLMYSGFVPKDNENDRFALVLGVSQNDSLFTKKKAVLAKLNMDLSNTFQIPKDISVLGLPQDLLSFLRVFVSTEPELDVLLSYTSDKFIAHFQQVPGAIPSDKVLLKYLQQRCKLLLMKYKNQVGQKHSKISKLASELASEITECERTILSTCMEYTSELLKNVDQ
eukprot:CFRG1641T1